MERVVNIHAPIAEDILECKFVSPADGETVSFLLKDFRAAETENAPALILYLHGALADQEQGMTAEIFENAFGKWVSEFTRLQAIYVCPQYRSGSWMGPAAETDLLEILRLLRVRYHPEKILLIGGSMGGTSVLIFASLHPQSMDGVIALCPATDMAEMYFLFPEQFDVSYGGSPIEVPAEYQKRSVCFRSSQLENIPVVIIHGAADELIPVSHSRRLASQLQGVNNRLRYVEIPAGDHNAPILYPLGKYLDFILKTP
ncbi:MAG: alpha/beta fold hydrolase [Chthoniobacterales bacterium]